jgi:AraC-like DNA-binding protein
LAAHHAVVECQHWHGLEETCASHPVTLAVLDLYASGAANFEAIRRLRARFAKLPLVAYVAADVDRVRDLFDAGRAGVDGLLLADHDDHSAAIRGVVDQAEARGVAGGLRQRIADAPPLPRDAILVSVTRAHARLTAQKLADVLATTPRQLARELVDAGFPPARACIAWGRLMVAAQMLEDERRSADAVARVLDYPSGSAFRNLCRRYLDATPQDIRARGGAPFVIDAFCRSLDPPR